MKNLLKKWTMAKYLVIVFRAFWTKPRLMEKTKAIIIFFMDHKKFKELPENPNFTIETRDLYPRIHDKTTETKLDPVYFIQGCWCARKIFENRPKNHHDIGSQAQMVGIISQFVPTTMVDLRPLSITLPGLSFVKGDITKLPFKDGSIDSLSSICVIEHIGLGRYGDKLDQFGTEKASTELARVLAPNGNLYISVPVDSANKIYFNAHRAFTRDYVVSVLFKSLTLVEEKYIYGKDIFEKYDPNKGFGTGLYYFQKKLT